MVYIHDLDKYLLGPWTLGPWTIADHVLGPFHNFGVRWYSLPYIFGFLAVYAVLHRAVVRCRIPNGTLDHLEEASLILIGSVLIGGRLGYFILNEPSTLTSLRGWLEVPQVWKGGMAFFGAAAAVFGFEYWYCRKHHLGFWHGADRMMWVLALALGFGRVANFINGELWGIPTGGDWGVVFPDVPPAQYVDGVNVPRHPVQLYSALTHWILGLWLLWCLYRRPRRDWERVPGYQIFYFFIGYGLLRFLTDFWRAEWFFWGPINGGQLLSLGLCLIGLVGMRLRYRAVQGSTDPCAWYPPEGADAPLPEECHDYLRSRQQAEQAAE